MFLYSIEYVKINLIRFSQAALKALESVIVRSKLVLECLGCLDELATQQFSSTGVGARA